MDTFVPRYKHDCEECSQFGQIENFDLYICPQGGHPTVVARNGDDPDSYTSGQRIHIVGLSIELTTTRSVMHQIFEESGA